MLAAAGEWGGAPTSGPTCRAPSRSRGRARGRGRALDFLLEAVGPGTERLARARAGRGPRAARPARHRLPRAGARARPLLVGGGIGAAPLLCWQRAGGRELGVRRPGRRGPARLPLRRARRGGRALRRAPEVVTDDGSVGRQGLVTELLAAQLDGDAECDGLRLRAAADARGRAGALRRARRARPARAGVRHGVRLRRLLRLRRADEETATCACASTARCSTRPSSRRRWSREPGTDGRLHRAPLDRAVRRPAARPGPERLGHVRRDRRASRLRRRAARALPVRRVRLEDDHARSRARATRRRGCGRRRRA